MIPFDLVPLRFEPGSLDSESRVLTITPLDRYTFILVSVKMELKI